MQFAPCKNTSSKCQQHLGHDGNAAAACRLRVPAALEQQQLCQTSPLQQRRPQAVPAPELTSRELGFHTNSSERVRAAAVLESPTRLGLSTLSPTAARDVPLEGATAVSSPVAKVWFTVWARLHLHSCRGIEQA